MKAGATWLLRAVIVLIGLAALVFLLAEPHFEGRNAHASLFAVYFRDPFLAYAYIAAVPFFVGLYQSFRLLAYSGINQEFSMPAVRAVRITKHCAIALVGFSIGGEVLIAFGDSDDRAGGVFIGALICCASIVVAAGMAVLEKTLQNAADMKSERDLTI